MTDWTARHPHRFALERRAMVHHFPAFRYTAQPFPAWLGMMAVPQFDRNFAVAYRYPSGYPDEAPHVFVLRPALPAETPHVNSDGSVCVHPVDCPLERWAPPASLALTAAWLFKFCDWQATGRTWR